MCIDHMKRSEFCLELPKTEKGNPMTKLSRAMEVAGKWLEIDGVDMIIPRPDTNEVVVVISCQPNSLKHLIPSTIHNFPVKVRYEKIHAA